MSQRQLATNVTDFSSGALGLVELAASYLNDRKLKFWSKSELAVYINESQDDLASEINRTYREYFYTSATTPTVANQSLYSLPTDMTELVTMEVVNDTSTDDEPQDLNEILLPDKMFYEKLDAANQKSEFQFFFIQGANFKLMPKPATANEFVRIFYVKRLTPMTNDTDISEIPDQHHDLLAVKAARRALIKTRDINTALEMRHAEGLEAMRDDIQRFSRYREETRRPWRGTYGYERYAANLGSVY